MPQSNPLHAIFPGQTCIETVDLFVTRMLGD